MEYIQMTLDDWLETKRKLDRVFMDIKKNFVRAGYFLRVTDDQKGYEREGCKSIAEFAEKAYHLSASTVSRFMEINREYSVDGYSEILRPEFEDFSRSQLEEMLKLPDSDRRMIQPETHREDIRQLKKFNKSEPEKGMADDIRQLIGKFYEENAEILKAVSGAPEFSEGEIKGFAEIVNPGGNRSYKKGLFFLMMYENKIVVKKFGSDPRDMTWWEFYGLTRDVIKDQAAEAETRNGRIAEEIASAQKSGEALGQEKQEGAGAEEESSAAGEKMDVRDAEEKASESENEAEPEEKIAPAQKSIETEGYEETGQAEDAEDGALKAAAGAEGIPGQMEIVKDFPEYCPEEMCGTQGESEPVREAYAGRLQYMASKEPEEAAAYMAESMKKKMNHISFNMMRGARFWETFFTAEVDEEGREIECV